MSIFVTLLCFDGEDGTRRPIRWQENVYPLDEDDRFGSFGLAYISAHIVEYGSAPDDAPLKPYLRVGMGDGYDDHMSAGMDVMLDRGQVEEVRDALTWWLGRTGEDAEG